MELTNNLEATTENCNVQVKCPKRILHFSDGTMEEYSDSDQEDVEQSQVVCKEDVVDTAKLGWGPWLLYKALRTGSVTLNACDYVGEALASFLGITTPKYQYELDEYRRLQKEKEKAAQEQENAKGWLNEPSTDNTTAMPIDCENNINNPQTSPLTEQ